MNQEGFHVHFILPVLAICAVAGIGTLLLKLSHADTSAHYAGACTSTTLTSASTNAHSCITYAQAILNGIEHQQLTAKRVGSYRIATSGSDPGVFPYRIGRASYYFLYMNGVYDTATQTAVHRMYGNSSLTGAASSNAWSSMGWQVLCTAAHNTGLDSGGAGASILRFGATRYEYVTATNAAIFKTACGSLVPNGVGSSAAGLAASSVPGSYVGPCTGQTLTVSTRSTVCARQVQDLIDAYIYSGGPQTVRAASGQTFSYNGRTYLIMNGEYGSQTGAIIRQITSSTNLIPMSEASNGAVTGSWNAFCTAIATFANNGNFHKTLDFSSTLGAGRTRANGYYTSSYAVDIFASTCGDTGSGRPSALQVFTGGNNIALVWNMPVATIKGVQVWRNGAYVATVSPSTNVSVQNQQLGKEYDDNAVTAGASYQYRVRGILADGTYSAFTPTISVTQPRNTTPVPNITLNTTGASTALASYMRTYMIPLLHTWYPKVGNKIAYPTYMPPRSYTVTFSGRGFEANACVTEAISNVMTVTCDPKWIASLMTQSQNGVAALFVHESTHVIQDNACGYGWQIEGGASWASDFFARQNINTYTPGQAASFGYTNNLLESYTPGAWFIEYMRDHYSSNFPHDLNVAIHDQAATAADSNSVVARDTRNRATTVLRAWQGAVGEYGGTASAAKIDGSSSCSG